MSSWVKSCFVLLSACLLISACGFEPMYGNTTMNSYGDVSTENKLSKIQIENIPNASGQYLRNELIDRFYRRGRPANTEYSLVVAPLEEQEVNLDITIESEHTRAQLKISTYIKLIDKATGDTLLAREIRGFNSYNVLGSQFTTIVSEQDAREDILDDLARQIETQIVLYFNRT